MAGKYKVFQLFLEKEQQFFAVPFFYAKKLKLRCIGVVIAVVFVIYQIINEYCGRVLRGIFTCEKR